MQGDAKTTETRGSAARTAVIFRGAKGRPPRAPRREAIKPAASQGGGGSGFAADSIASTAIAPTVTLRERRRAMSGDELELLVTKARGQVLAPREAKSDAHAESRPRASTDSGPRPKATNHFKHRRRNFFSTGKLEPLSKDYQVVISPHSLWRVHGVAANKDLSDLTLTGGHAYFADPLSSTRHLDFQRLAKLEISLWPQHLIQKRVLTPEEMEAVRIYLQSSASSPELESSDLISLSSGSFDINYAIPSCHNPSYWAHVSLQEGDLLESLYLHLLPLIPPTMMFDGDPIEALHHCKVQVKEMSMKEADAFRVFQVHAEEQAAIITELQDQMRVQELEGIRRVSRPRSQTDPTSNPKPGLIKKAMVFAQSFLGGASSAEAMPSRERGTSASWLRPQTPPLRQLFELEKAGQIRLSEGDLRKIERRFCHA